MWGIWFKVYFCGEKFIKIYLKMIIFSARNVVQSSPATLTWGFTLMIDIFASQGNMMLFMVSFFIEPWCPWKINGLKRIYQICPFSGRNTFSKIWNKDTSPFRFHCTQCPNKYNRPDQFRFSFKFQVQKPLWEIQIFTMSWFEQYQNGWFQFSVVANQN